MSRQSPATMQKKAVSADFVRQLRRAVGKGAILSDPDELLVYECDGHVIKKQAPDVVVLPESTEQVTSVVRLCNQFRVPFVSRGAGTGLASGCLSVDGGAMIATTRMCRIHEVNLRDRYAVVDPGVVNSHLNRYLSGSGYHFAPDPSSQAACTLGGNVAMNSSGPHALKYGATASHVLGLEVVLPDGSVVELGGTAEDLPGYDLAGLFVGSEGTLGICTRITVRLTRNPAANRTLLVAFETIRDATEAVGHILRTGILPAALEMIDRGIIEALGAADRFNVPPDGDAMLLIDVDGLNVSVESETQGIAEICRTHAAKEIRRPEPDDERERFWKCRHQALGAVGRLSPGYCVQDGVVPPSKLAEILDFISECSQRHQIRVVNVAHAGDGNLQTVFLFDKQDDRQIQRARDAGDEILAKCVELGGSITGGHGIGVEKVRLMNKQCQDVDLEVMAAVRRAFNASRSCNPGRLLPTDSDCGTERAPVAVPGHNVSV